MRPVHFVLVSAVSAFATGCPAETSDTPGVCTLTAAPAATPVGGDANGDGFVDVSDGAALARYVLAGGPAPACPDALDLVPDGVVNPADALAVWYSVGAKSAPYRPDAEDCAAAERTATPACGDGLALGVSAPASAEASATFTADITLTSPTVAPEAWSFTLEASGCTLSAGTTEGTAAAEKGLGTGGLRDGGVAWQKVEAAEAQVLTVLDWRNQGTLPIGAASPIHRVEVVGDACGACTLTLVPGSPEGVESVVSGDGWRYVPALGKATIAICG